MRNKRIVELFGKERRLNRELNRKTERYAELVEKAISTGSFRYDQEKVTGSILDGSRQERIVAEYMLLEEEVQELTERLYEVQMQIAKLISKLPPRERRLMCDRHIKHENPEEIMKRYEITYETYRTYHCRAMKRMENMMQNGSP